MNLDENALQALLDKGYWRCPAPCGGIAHPVVPVCRMCGHKKDQPAAAAVRRAPSLAGPRASAAAALGALPGGGLDVVVLGVPVTQGSMNAVAAGVVLHTKAAELKAWRRAVATAALAKVGPGWEPVNAAVMLDVVFTLPRPASAPKRKVVWPATKPDLDKLLRAICDGLCPSSGPKILAEDSRVVGSGRLAKTYPAPLGTDEWALDEPGVRLRLYPAPAPQVRV